MDNSAIVAALRSQQPSDAKPPVKMWYGKEERTPYPSELDFFKKNVHVAGMASEDNRIVMNPYSPLTENELNSVRMNEAARLHMREVAPPDFELTDEQSRALGGSYYANASNADRSATIAARILSGDPSAGAPTPRQLEYVRQLRERMGIK